MECTIRVLLRKRSLQLNFIILLRHCVFGTLPKQILQDPSMALTEHRLGHFW